MKPRYNLRISLRYPFFLSNGRVKKRISAQEVNLLWGLMTRRYTTREATAEILWPNPDVMPNDWRNTIGQHVFRLRRALKLFEWTIVFHRLVGYELQKTNPT